MIQKKEAEWSFDGGLIPGVVFIPTLGVIREKTNINEPKVEWSLVGMWLCFSFIITRKK